MPSVPPRARSFVADLHIHSKYSRACSRDLELGNLAWWAQRKGIALLGTGDFTHPGWYDHLRETLVPAEPGLYRLAPEREAEVARRLPPNLHQPVRFMLSVEISTIYKRDDRMRKVHHLIYLPDLNAVARFNGKLGHGPRGLGGNLGSDGRPILGLDSRDLLEIALESSSDGFLVPAHIWTPWFSALGSRSGFDAIADCYADLAGHIRAVETGLSSDPELNWRVSSLDGYQLVSNSDAHSPQALAREATVLATEMDYYAVRAALDTGIGLESTLEFFPEQGKYHADGHRACGVCWEPAQTRAAAGVCPECGKPLTIGVLHRVEELADRPAGYRPPNRPPAHHLLQLHQVLGEIHNVGAKAKAVTARLDGLVASIGSELDILLRADLTDVAQMGGEMLGEAVARLRRGEVRRSPGYDGEYGVIRLFDDAELGGPGVLFDLPAPAMARRPAAPRKPRTKREPPEAPPPVHAPTSPHRPWEPVLAGMEEVGTGLLDRLDALQRVAASAPGGPVLVVAGPGTGKTRTLTHRIAYLCADLKVRPEQCLAITFTRRAAEEMRARLGVLLGPAARDVAVATFHALGLSILREHPDAAGLGPDFGVADDAQRDGARALAGDDEAAFVKALRERNLVDLGELVTVPVGLLRDDRDLVEEYRQRWPWLFVDEYQDIDADQYELLRLLVPTAGNVFAIGDPDQAIYSFRGGDVGYFLRFREDFTDPHVVRLTRNYRSAAPIIAAASQAIAPTSLVRGRRLEPAKLEPDAPPIGVYPAATVAAEANWLAATIDELVGGVSHRSFDGRVDSRATAADELSFADIAVLYRTDAQAQPIVEALTAANIPVQKRSHDRLASRRAVVAIAREVRFDTGATMIDRVRAVGGVLASGRPPLFEVDGAASAMLTESEVYTAVELLLPLAARCEDDLESFLQALAMGAEVDALDSRAQAVTLLTLHAAKGLEWPVVFMVGCEDGLLPLRFRGTEPDEQAVAEERRLFFVGMTRAQRRLYLSHVARRTRHSSEAEPSRTPFLAPVDPGLLQLLGEAAARSDRPRHRQLRLL
jgi:DNA helicase-2/ATP-dependent DNA helicase PcrA